MKICALFFFLLSILAAIQANSSPETSAITDENLKKTAG
ncbi:uncharacterized protein LOC117145294 [Drosophila mauritiana]|uniref:Uncharacterized protein LOC117145294 n=1 Tax=Drosophila mauritiana TaxID=7226 RepID=A0A6P8KU91_DROMA|nr:uncharacterized protein LOC117145294 [Drosophila mauritiana]